MLELSWPVTASGRASRLLPLALGLAAAYALYRLRQRERRRQRRQRWNAAGHNVVVLHQFGRATVSPNLSPFALKLETFLRMADIQYVIDTAKPLGPKGKCPWITINGCDVTDTELIMAHLLTLFPAVLPGRLSLTSEQHALGRAVQTALDEHLVFAVAAHRYTIDCLRHLVPAMSARYRRKFALLRSLAALVAARRFSQIGWGGRSREQVLLLMRKDLQAVSDLLGERQYLLGDEVTEYDACVFGHLTQLLTGCAPEVGQLAREYPRLVRYFDRIKGRYWPDWEQCLSP